MAVEKSVVEPDGLRHRKQKEKVQKHSISSFKDTGNGSTCGIWNWLADPIDPISISLFRVLFSFGMAWHMVVLLKKNTLRANFLFPELNFHYPLCRYCFDTPSFEYVVLISLTALLSSVTMMIGFFTKFSATIFLITYVWLNALEKSRYNNHYYFYANLAFLLTMTGSGQKLSIDSFFRKQFRKNVVPRWNLCILQFIIVVCYFYAGIAKMNYDWFLRGEPMTSWLYDKEFFKDYPLDIAKVMGYFTSLGGLVFDTFIGFILLSKLKYFGFLLTTIFHISNHFLFQIGTFPWVMLSTNILFVSPEFITKLFLKFKLISSIHKQDKSETFNDNNHSTETKSSHHFAKNNSLTEETSEQNISWKVKFFLGCFVGYHLVMPLRHWVYNTEHSTVNWTMTGHQFSWRMMLNDEDVLLRLHAKLDINSDEEVIQNIYQMRMNARQVKRMITDLDLILQFIKHCKTLSPGTKDSPAYIRIDLWKALNGRPYQRWVDPDIYLNQRSPDEWSQDWIRPMLPDDIIDFEELEKIKLMNLNKSIGTSFFMEGKNETFSTLHHKRAGCKIINVTCLQGELFYKQGQHDEEKKKKLLPGMKITIPLDTSYRLYTMESTAVWMYEHDCHVGFFHAGMQMLSTQGWGAI